MGTTIGAILVDTRSLDYGSYGLWGFGFRSSGIWVSMAYDFCGLRLRALG